jgi:DNA-binding winged helix-turn-helix (wHTH) protein
MYEFPPFRLDTANQCLLRTGPSEKEVRIQLPPKAFSILHYLVDNADRLVTQYELMDKAWPDTFVQPEVLTSHIRDIRAALGVGQWEARARQFTIINKAATFQVAEAPLITPCITTVKATTLT